MRSSCVVLAMLLAGFTSQARVAPTVSGFAVAAHWTGVNDWGGFGRIMKYDIVNGKTVHTSVLYNGNGRMATINPDGQRVAFFRTDDTAAGLISQGRTSPGGLACMSASGGTPVTLLSGMSYLACYHNFCDWPAGDWLFYGKCTDGNPDTYPNEIWKINVNTKQTVKVCKINSGLHIWQFSVTNDGLKAIVRIMESSVFRFVLTDSIAFDISDNTTDPNHVTLGAGCGSSVSPDGLTLMSLFTGGHDNVRFQGWNYSLIKELPLRIVNGWDTIVGMGFNNNRWSCNDDKWICANNGIDSRAAVTGSNQVLINWVDSQVVRTSTDTGAIVIAFPADRNNKSQQNETGDFWVNHGATAVQNKAPAVYAGEGVSVLLRITNANLAACAAVFRVNPSKAEQVSLLIVDVNGRLLHQAANFVRAMGAPGYTVTWDGKTRTGQTVARGMYLVQCRFGNTVQTRRLFVR